MRRLHWVSSALLLCVACGSSSAPSDDPLVADRYGAQGTVLENAKHGPEICFNVLTSLPPQCGGIPITNWDRSAVDDETSSGGTIWGEYHLVGTYDGERFTLTEPAQAPQPSEPPTAELQPVPCDEPRGGWRVRDDARATEDAFNHAVAEAQARSGFAGSWVSSLEQRVTEGETMDGYILIIGFTDDPSRHEQELREIWGGALCVTEMARSEAYLQRVQREVMDLGHRLGFEILSAGVDPSANVVTIEAVLVTDEQQAELDRRYGEGVVKASSALRRLD